MELTGMSQSVQRAVEIDYRRGHRARDHDPPGKLPVIPGGVHFEEGEFLGPLALIHTRSKVLSPAMKKLIALLTHQTPG